MSSRARVRPQHTSGSAVAALACGLLALALSWVPVLGLAAFPLGTIAMATAFVAFRNLRRTSMAGRGLAVVGVVTGGLGLLIATTLLVSFLSGFRGPAFRDDVGEVRDLFDTEPP